MLLTDPLNFILITFFMFMIIVARYVLIAGLFQFWFYTLRKDQWRSRRLGKKTIEKKQFYQEVKWSFITSLIFAVAGSLTALFWQKGYTHLYFGHY